METHAITAEAPPRRVISDALLGMTEEELAVLPKRKSLTTRIQRKPRRVEDDCPPEPTAAADLIIPAKYQMTSHVADAVQFLLHEDDPDVSGRMVIITSESMLRHLEQATTILCDGTFKVVPNQFYQLYTVHFIKHDAVFACVYALLPSKTQTIYVRMWEVIQQHCPNFAPRYAVTDFEKAAQEALVQVFPDCQLEGCFFHFTQAIWRKIQALDLRNAYIEDDQVRFHCKSWCSLAFLPEADVMPAFENLDEDIAEANIQNVDLQPLMSYFKDTYIGRLTRRQGRRLPHIAPALWNVRERTIEGIPRTTNH
jgi:hypothetical protein